MEEAGAMKRIAPASMPDRWVYRGPLEADVELTPPSGVS